MRLYKELLWKPLNKTFRYFYPTFFVEIEKNLKIKNDENLLRSALSGLIIFLRALLPSEISQKFTATVFACVSITAIVFPRNIFAEV